MASDLETVLANFLLAAGGVGGGSRSGSKPKITAPAHESFQPSAVTSNLLAQAPSNEFALGHAAAAAAQDRTNRLDYLDALEQTNSLAGALMQKDMMNDRELAILKENLGPFHQYGVSGQAAVEMASRLAALGLRPGVENTAPEFTRSSGFADDLRRAKGMSDLGTAFDKGGIRPNQDVARSLGVGTIGAPPARGSGSKGTRPQVTLTGHIRGTDLTGVVRAGSGAEARQLAADSNMIVPPAADPHTDSPKPQPSAQNTARGSADNIPEPVKAAARREMQRITETEGQAPRPAVDAEGNVYLQSKDGTIQITIDSNGEVKVRPVQIGQ